MQCRRFVFVLGGTCLLLLLAAVDFALAGDVSSAARNSARAQRSSTTEEIRQLAGPFQPPRADHLARYRARAIAHVNELTRPLKRSATAESAALLERLHVGQLSVILADEPNDARELRKLLMPFYGNFSGLEREDVLRARDSLNQYQLAMLVFSSPDLSREYDRRLGEIATLFATDTRADGAALGEHIAWLESAGQAPRLVSNLQRHYSRPNAVVQISRKMILAELAGLQREFTHRTHVDSVILGAQVSGPAYTTTRIESLLPPRGEPSYVQLRIAGTVDAPANVAQLPPVTIYSRSRTDFQASASLYLDGWQLRSQPTKVFARTSTVFEGAEPQGRRGPVRSNVLSSAALRRANRMRDESEAQASNIAERQVAQQVDQQIGDRLARANNEIRQSLLAPLARLDMLPRIDTAITESQLQVMLTRATPGNLSADSLSPWPDLSGDIDVAIHESALNALLFPMCGGAAWTDKQFAEIQRQALGDNSYELRIGAHPRWAVVLDPWRPLAAQIDKRGVQFCIRVTELHTDDGHFPFPFQVEARYTMRPTTTTTKLSRLGSVRFAWTTSSRPAPDQEALVREFALRKFSGFFLDEAYLDGLNAPSGGAWGNASRLRHARVDFADGWMRLVFTRQPDEPVLGGLRSK